MFSHLDDLRFAARTLARRPTFAVVAVLTLGLGIGGSTALFATAYAALARPLPFPDESRLVRLYQLRDGSATRFSLRSATFDAVARRARAFEALVGHRFRDVTLQIAATPERIVGIGVSDRWAEATRVAPLLGRTFTEEEMAAGEAASAVVVSHAFWRDRLGAEARALGRSVVLDGRAHVVVGVMPPAFRHPYDADVWLPSRVEAGVQRTWSLNAMGRLAPGVSLEAANAELAALSELLAIELPEGHRNAKLVALPLRETLLGEAPGSLIALFAATGFLVLIVCANLANLLLARGLGRRQELALRAALGASRYRRARLVLSESLLLALAGLLLGLGVAAVGLAGLDDLVPAPIHAAGGPPALDAAALGFAVLASFVAACVLGAAPALAASRIDLRDALAATARVEGGSGSRWLDGFVVAQVGLCLVLLSGAGLLARNLFRLQGAGLGYETQGLELFSVALDGPSFTPERRASFVRELESALRGLPGALEAGATNLFPLSGGTTSLRVSADPARDPQSVNVRFVTPGFLRALGLHARRGRVLDERDGPGGARVTVLSESLARRLFPAQDPVGARLRNPRQEGEVVELQVVGVVPDVREIEEEQTLYLAQAQEAAHPFTGRATFVLRTQAPVGEAQLRSAVAALDPTLAVYDAQAAVRVQDEYLAPQRMSTGLFTAFAGFGLALCLIGIYGVLSARVGTRRREIAIRLALGAAPRHVLGGVLLRGACLVGAGLGLGLLASLSLRRAVASLVSEVDPGDPVALAFALGLLGLMAFAAALPPALRAVRTQPAEVLRSE
jgi:predicted permease